MPPGAALPAFDVQAPLMSLPLLLGIAPVGHVFYVPDEDRQLGNVLSTHGPAAVGHNGHVANGHVKNVPHRDAAYISPDPERVRRWGKELAGFTGFKIGIAWQGSRSYQDDRFRSIPLAKFEPIARVAGTRLFSLQKGYGCEQLGKLRGWTVHDFGKQLDADGAFLDTAAVMKHLDLVITSDTAIAHLAGALGVPVWLAASTAADWRWLQECDDSPWYPTMRLFRQKRRGDWDGVFAWMASALETHPRLETAQRHADRGLALLKQGKTAEAAVTLGARWNWSRRTRSCTTTARSRSIAKERRRRRWLAFRRPSGSWTITSMPATTWATW